MKNLTIENICRVCGGEWIGTTAAPGAEITAVTTDSRAVTPGCLFAAIPGERVDGHDYIASAVEAGASTLIIGLQNEDVQIRQEVRRRLIQIQNVFRVQDAQGQRRKGFAERSDAEHRVRQDRQIVLYAALSESIFEQHALRSADADRDAGAALFFDFLL